MCQYANTETTASTSTTATTTKTTTTTTTSTTCSTQINGTFTTAALSVIPAFLIPSLLLFYSYYYYCYSHSPSPPPPFPSPTTSTSPSVTYIAATAGPIFTLYSAPSCAANIFLCCMI